MPVANVITHANFDHSVNRWRIGNWKEEAMAPTHVLRKKTFLFKISTAGNARLTTEPTVSYITNANARINILRI